MPRRTWWEIFSGVLNLGISSEVPTPQLYLELAKKRMEYVKRITSQSSSSLWVNRRLCQHLANKLEIVLRELENSALLHESQSVTQESIGILKLFERCTKEVEAFIKISCSQDNRVQAAIVLSNVSEHVSSLCLELEFCALLLRQGRSPFAKITDLDALYKSKSISEIVRRDQRDLQRKLEDLYRSSNSSETQRLFKNLSQRLNQHLSGKVQPEVLEVDFSTLRRGPKLGRGGSGTVYKANWLGMEVAEKMFDGPDHPDFRNEMKILGGLAHPNIVPLLGYAVHNGGCSIVMELMAEDLSLLMKNRLDRQNPTRRFPFTTAEAVDLMLQTAQGMLYLHENRVVHRDLKSGNILVKCDEFIYAKVADFGLSKTKERSITHSKLTPNIGTTRWMAPELMTQQDHNSDKRTELKYPFKVDVYSFGMVCYEILTGTVPFSDITSKKMKTKVLAGIRPDLPKECLTEFPDVCRSELKALIHKCWESDPGVRPSFVYICKKLRFVKCCVVQNVGFV